jgi:hypothetical protein
MKFLYQSNRVYIMHLVRETAFAGPEELYVVIVKPLQIEKGRLDASSRPFFWFCFSFLAPLRVRVSMDFPSTHPCYWSAG